MNSQLQIETAYQIGLEVLGPPFLAFVRLLLSAAEEDSILKLLFVARDGEFLMRATETAIECGTSTSFPKLGYLHLSRVSTALPGELRFDRASVLRAAEVRAGTPIIGHLLAYYGLNPHEYAADLGRYGLHEDSPLVSDRIEPLLADAGFQARIESDRTVQRELLRDYLRQQGAIGQSGAAVVDIGWRGAICSALQAAFGNRGDALPLHAYYLGYWHESGCHPLPGMQVRGLLADCRLGRSLREGAARYLAFPLEALCRADHGTVTGYRRTNAGIVEPVLAEPWDACSSPARNEIRRGILDHIRAHANLAVAHTPAEAARLRRDAQRRLFRLAFFPNAQEIDCLRSLQHSEGHATGWRRDLIDHPPPSPWLHPRRWLAGLASPWRTGYVMASGGPVLAALFVAAESFLSVLPSSWRNGLQEWARQRAGLR